MAEPVSTTYTAVGAVGLSTLLVGWMGPLAAEYAMIVLAALAGCTLALSNVGTHRTFAQAFSYILRALFVAVLMSAVIAFLLGSVFAALNNPATTPVVAFCIGLTLDRIKGFANNYFNKVTKG